MSAAEIGQVLLAATVISSMMDRFQDASISRVMEVQHE